LEKTFKIIKSNRQTCINAITLLHVCSSTSFVQSIQLHLLPPATFYHASSHSFSKLWALHCLVHADNLPSITSLTKQRWGTQWKEVL